MRACTSRASRWWWRSLVGYRPRRCSRIVGGGHDIQGGARALFYRSPDVGIAGFSSLLAHGWCSDFLLQERLCCNGHSGSAAAAATNATGALQQRRCFLGIGDGDEESGASVHFEEDRIIGYSPEQVYAVVAAVDLYEDFVPWCQSSRVLWRKNDEALDAELEVGFKFFVERYISHVLLKPPNLIKTTVSQSNLFDHLNNEWSFKPGPTPNSCHLHFKVDFQFHSPLYRQVAQTFCNEVQARMVSSFEERCRLVYGVSMVY